MSTLLNVRFHSASLIFRLVGKYIYVTILHYADLTYAGSMQCAGGSEAGSGTYRLPAAVGPARAAAVRTSVIFARPVAVCGFVSEEKLPLCRRSDSDGSADGAVSTYQPYKANKTRTP